MTLNIRLGWVTVVVLVAIIAIAYFMFPLMDGIILGTVFAYIGRPIRDMFGARKRLGSAIASIWIIVPISLVLILGVMEIANIFMWIAQNQGSIAREISSKISGLEIPEEIYTLITGSLQNVLSFVADVAARMPIFDYGRRMILLAINLVLSIPVCYFLLCDGERFVDAWFTIVPEERLETYRAYFERIDRILSGIFLGSMYTAIVGSVISAIVFYAFDVPRPFAMASLVFIAGLVPVLTAWAVIVPISVYRYLLLGPAEALMFFAVASALIYLPSELIIRPYLVAARSSLHPLLVILSFLGGAMVAGIGGFFLAPAIMGVIVGIYQVRREQSLAKEPQSERDL